MGGAWCTRVVGMRDAAPRPVSRVRSPAASSALSHHPSSTMTPTTSIPATTTPRRLPHLLSPPRAAPRAPPARGLPPSPSLHCANHARLPCSCSLHHHAPAPPLACSSSLRPLHRLACTCSRLPRPSRPPSPHPHSPVRHRISFHSSCPPLPPPHLFPPSRSRPSPHLQHPSLLLPFAVRCVDWRFDQIVDQFELSFSLYILSLPPSFFLSLL